MAAFVFYPDPPLLRLLQLTLLMTGVRVAILEFSGRNLRYSKFAPSNGIKKQVASKLGMLGFYVPSFLLSALFLLFKLGWFDVRFVLDTLHLDPLATVLWNYQGGSTRLILLASALSLHFCKRVLEVLFLHVYSGSLDLEMVFSISFWYAFLCGSVLYSQQIAEELQPPSIDTLWYGVITFLVGVSGNFYHHYLLASLRKPRGKDNMQNQGKYVVPHGGLFSMVVCPHYLFEIVDFVGLALISQTLTSFCAAIATASLLAMRSKSTKQWYLKKVEGFPAQRKALIPFIL